MDIGMIGLGRMGGNMAKRLLAGGHRVVGHDRAGAFKDDVRRELGGHAEARREGGQP